MRVRMLVAVVGLAGLSTALMGAIPAGAGPSGDQDAFCDGVVDVSVLFNKIDGEPTPKQQQKIDTALETIEDNAPAEVADQVQTAVTGTREGNFVDPAVRAAITAVDAWVADNCGYEVVDVTATEYQFEGIPETLEAGTTLFRFTNEGAELHEIGIARIKGDESVEEILELPEEEADSKVTFVGANFAVQGETTILYTKLTKAGTYGAVCFIPVGATTEEAIETADGPPHFVEGMFAEFEVTK